MPSYTVDPTRALPTDAYRSDAFDVERELIWRSDWVFVGTADEVAEPGDYVSVTLGDQPVIVLRNQSGELTALSNLCAHRGTVLVEGAGNTKRFQCPYHAWTYRDDGGLLSVPYAKPADVDKNAHCLPQYRAEDWHGLIFATMNPDVGPLAKRLGHLDDIAEAAGLSSLNHWTSEREEEVWDANWKLVVSNAMESYHLFKVHPETLEPYNPTASAYYIKGNADGTATGGANRDEDDYTLLFLAPNIVGVLANDAFLWQAVFPLAADRTRVMLGGAYRHRSPGEMSGVGKWTTRAATKAARTLVPDFLPEDKDICERGQRAANGHYRPGVLVPMEQVISDFHHYLNRQLHGADVPPVRTSDDVGVAKPPAGVEADS
ncbi:MAG: aromatic ring-hydroxylating oxygenase subunit alpha [Acidimicrobiales bacterium]